MLVHRTDLGVAGHVAFEEPGGQVVAQQAGPRLTLGEGHEVILLGGGKHPLKGVVSGREPLLAQLFLGSVRSRSGGSHR